MKIFSTLLLFLLLAGCAGHHAKSESIATPEAIDDENSKTVWVGYLPFSTSPAISQELIADIQLRVQLRTTYRTVSHELIEMKVPYSTGSYFGCTGARHWHLTYQADDETQLVFWFVAQDPDAEPLLMDVYIARHHAGRRWIEGPVVTRMQPDPIVQRPSAPTTCDFKIEKSVDYDSTFENTRLE